MLTEKIVKMFSEKYQTTSDIWAVGRGENTIVVYTSNAKAWVDLPSKFMGFKVEMVVSKPPIPLSSNKN